MLPGADELLVILQGTIFPHLGNAVFGLCPIIIGLLHLVFIGTGAKQRDRLSSPVHGYSMYNRLLNGP